MFKNLALDTIGIKADLNKSLKYAEIGGFTGIDLNMTDIVSEVESSSISDVKDKFSLNNIRAAGWNIDCAWETNEKIFAVELKKLEKIARISNELGCNRAYTYILPFSDDLDYKDNLIFHKKRIADIANILANQNITLGLEFVGPQTLRDDKKYTFIYTLDQLLQLIDSIAPKNIGVLLDSFHLYTSGGNNEDIKKLTKDTLVYVHINDAKRVPINKQIDNKRELPGATGVLDIQGFLQAVFDTGYNGPVTAEPFCEKLYKAPEELRVKLTGDAMSNVWDEKFNQ